MKIASIILLGIIITASVTSCKKDTFITSPNAIVALSTDTLYFDTVFTTTGSITGEFKIFNQNNQKLLLSNVQLMGGATSYFKFNLDALRVLFSIMSPSLPMIVCMDLLL